MQPKVRPFYKIPKATEICTNSLTPDSGILRACLFSSFSDSVVVGVRLAFECSAKGSRGPDTAASRERQGVGTRPDLAPPLVFGAEHWGEIMHTNGGHEAQVSGTGQSPNDVGVDVTFTETSSQNLPLEPKTRAKVKSGKRHK